MTDPTETLAAWRAVTEGATDGPWEARHHDALDWLSQSPLVESSDHQPGSSVRPSGVTDPQWASVWPNRNAEADAAFIAAARDAMPRLLAAVEAVLALTDDVGNESTGPTFVACYEVRAALAEHLGGEGR